MATIFTSNYDGGYGYLYEFKAEAWETDVDINNNRSTVNVDIYLRRNRLSSGSAWNNNGTDWGITIEGENFTGNKTWDTRNTTEWIWIGYASKVVTHNSDGKKSASISAWHVGNSASGSSRMGNSSGSGSLTLTDIPRQANLTGATDFNDEGNPIIYYSNPAGNSVSSLQACISITGALADVPYRDVSKTGSSYTFYLTEAERNTLRSKCPNSNSLGVIFYLKTVIGNNTYYSTWNRSMYMTNANPTFTNHEFEDINEKTKILTGDKYSLISRYSQLKITIPSSMKAVARKYATMVKYRTSCGNASADINYSSSSNVSATLTNITSGTINTYAIDSRGNSTLVTKQATNYIAYSDIVKGNISLTRTNGISEEVTLEVDGTFDNVNFGAKTNSIKVMKFRYKTGNNDWSQYTNITPTISSKKFSYKGLIRGDTATHGFDINNSYQFELYVEDELSSATYTATLGSGIPNIALHKNGVSIMGKYDEQIGGYLQINGKRADNRYALSEVPIGIWVDGKTIYRKVIDFGYLPSDTQINKSVSTGLDITKIRVINFHSVCKTSSGTTFAIPSARREFATQIGMWIDGSSNVVIETGGYDRSQFYAHVVLEYIKI